jgi:hypothetical protein
VVLHATRGMVVAADALAVSGDRAMRALQSACRQQHITQFDMKCRLFDALVEPVLSYASHVWGPELFSGGKLVAMVRPSKSDKVHTDYLRMMAGAGKSTCTDVLLRDFGRNPVMHHWVVLASRWFAKLGAMPPGRMAHHAWLADITIMMAGCKKCWTFQILSTLTSLGVLQQASWDATLVGSEITSEDIQRICVSEVAVKDALHLLSRSRWNVGHVDPRTAPSVGIERCTHAAWVYPLIDGSVGHRPKHLTLCLSFKVLQCLARFRLGWHHLQVQVGRTKRPRVPRAARLCRLCSVEGGPCHVAAGADLPCVEDLMHFMLDCPAYASIRLRFPTVFAGTEPVLGDSHARMRAIFGTARQEQLAICMYTMNARRLELLNPPTNPPVDDVELLRIL